MESKLGNTVQKLTKSGAGRVREAAEALKQKWHQMAQEARKRQAAKAQAANPPATAADSAPKTEAPDSAGPSADAAAEMEVKPAAPDSNGGDAECTSSSSAPAESTTPVPLTASNSMSVAVPKRPTAKTGDPTRDSVREKLQDVFEAGKVASAAYLREQYVNTAEMSEEAEAHMFKVFDGVSKEYKARFRSLMFNLKDPKNPEFIRMVMTGQLHVNDLAEMKVVEMASDEMKKQRHQAAENAKMALMDEKTYKQYAGKETQDGILKCPRCKSMKTEYIEVQTRSADEPTTKKCTCNACDYRWKFC